MSTPALKLSARIESRNPRHAQIGVFQNGGKAGLLCVDAEYAEEIVGLLNAIRPDPQAMEGSTCTNATNTHATA